MLTQEEIQRMFEEMGLSGEEERQVFIELDKLTSLEQKEKEEIFILSVASTEEQKGEEDA